MAPKHGPKQFDVQMENNGGNNNAYTSEDVTVYTDWFPKTALELMFDMETDRMRDLAFDPKMVESERGVVYSERRTSVDNDNVGLLAEQLRATAIQAHPYHWPVIGGRPTLRRGRWPISRRTSGWVTLPTTASPSSRAT